MPDRKLLQARHEFACALQSALTLDEVSKVFTESVVDVIGADSVGMYRLGADAKEILEIRTDASAEFLDQYEEFGRDDDPVLKFVLRERRPIDSSRVISAAGWQASGAREALGGAGYAHSMETALCATDVFLGTLNFARTEAREPFSRDDLTSARLVSEQVGLATERALRFELAGYRTSAIEGALDRLPQAVIVTNLDAETIFRNHAARSDPALTAPGGAVQASIAAGIDEALAAFRTQRKRVHVTVVGEAGNQRIVKTLHLGDHRSTAVTLVFDRGGPASAPALPAWEVLSRREQEIAQLISEGLSTKQIAERAFITENTVKQHLKRVFAKTSARNRAELIQLIWSSGRPEQDPDGA
ncbi:LuxR C-terminal-related transcriptional regulator [Amycolatopsis jejuensis]|uniref:LuxR C-terminal-related transcriptional regulator n=1 Tax=Amycolatopsis jejuensis TaxID=330084 RepID=UPI00068D0054|nr:LuxR C-terminal-related transcriptional regulator [Amycolatopsis jejuensis]